MENKTNQVVSTKVLPFDATVSMGEFYDESTRETKQFVGVTLINPFEGEDFSGIRIAPKWRSTKGVFDFKAKKVLKSRTEFEISGEIRLATYYSKKKKRTVTYPGMFVRDLFDAEREIEFGVKREEDAAVFSMLASQFFNASLEPETAESESPLN